MGVTRNVAAVSCDEAFLDVTGLGDAVELARKLRADIRGATGCAASCGVGPSMLLARLATKRAKPDGLVAISPGQVCGAPRRCSGQGWGLEYLHWLLPGNFIRASQTACAGCAWMGPVCTSLLFVPAGLPGPPNAF